MARAKQTGNSGLPEEFSTSENPGVERPETGRGTGEERMRRCVQPEGMIILLGALMKGWGNDLYNLID